MIPQDLLDILACPKCKGPLEYKTTPDGREDAFICRTCRLLYPVVDDIPNFIIEEAKPIEADSK